MKKWRIRQRHEDCHYEAVIEYVGNPLNPVIAYGFTQEEADSKVLSKFIERENKQKIRGKG